MHAAIEILIGGLLQGSVFALVALGFALVYRVTGAVNLAQGAFVVLGAMLMFTLHQTLKWPLIPALLTSLIATMIVGTTVARLVILPGLRRLPLSGMVLLTGGLLTFFEGAILVIWGSAPYQLSTWSGDGLVPVFGFDIPSQGIWEVAVAVAIVLVLGYVLQRTTLGQALRACAENSAAASLMGIDVERMRVVSYALAAGIGGITGMVIGPILSLQFDTGTYYSISGLLGVAIGGFASFAGALLGGLGLGALEQFASGYVSSLFAMTFALAFLLAVLIWRPNGLFTSARRREDVREISTHPVVPLVRLSKRTIGIAGTLAVVFIAVLPFILQGSGALSGIVITGLLFIALLGLDVLLGYAGQVSLGHTAFLAIGAYSAAICTTRYHWEPIAGIAVGLVISLACATILSLVTVRLRGHYMALATLSFGLLADSIAVGATALTGGPSGITGVPHFAIGRFSFDSELQNYYFVWIIAIVATIGLANLMRSGFGRALRAIRTDQTAARALGINVPRYKLLAFIISAAFVSVAGSLYAFYFQYISPEMVGTNRIFDLLGSLVVGGEGTLVGPVIGAAILTLLPSIFQPFAIYKTLAVGALLILALLYFPTGIYGGIIRMAQKRGSRKGEPTLDSANVARQP